MVFAHAPVGIALLDRDLRLLRVNDRIAEISGAPADEHLGRTIGELLPDLPPQVQEDAARVARTGTPLSEVEVSGVERRWVASYWPVRRVRGGATIGVGLVMIEVTERRAAERALREQTDRYEALLHALSDAGEGLVVLELDGRCVFANAAFEQLSGYTFPELAAMDSVLDLVGEYEQDEVRQRVLKRIEEGFVAPGSRSPCAAATAAGSTSRSAARRSTSRAPPARRRRPQRHRPPAGRGRARAAAGPRRAAGRGERAVRPVARRGAHAAPRRAAVRARASPTPA